MSLLSELGSCVGHLDQCESRADELRAILMGEEDWSDENVLRALACLVDRIPIVREKIIAVAEEERQRILEAK